MDPTTVVVVIVLVVLLLIVAKMSIRIVRQYEKGVLFRLGRVIGVRDPGLRLIIPVIDRLPLVSLRIVTMPIQSQGIITQDNVSVDVSAVAYYRVVDAVKSVVAIENVAAAIDQIAQTTLRKVVGQHTLDQTLSETGRINVDIREILDVLTVEWGVEVTLVELKDIQLPESMKRAMARQAEAEREKRAKIIAAEGEAIAAAALGDASDTMMAHPLALQLRNLQSLVEIGVDKNTTVVFPAPLMSTIGELSRSWPAKTWPRHPPAARHPSKRHPDVSPSNGTNSQRRCRNIGNCSFTRATVSSETSTARTPAPAQGPPRRTPSDPPARSAPRTPAAPGTPRPRTRCSRWPGPRSAPATAPSCACPAPRTSRPAAPARRRRPGTWPAPGTAGRSRSSARTALPRLEHHRLGGRARLDERRLPEALRVEQVDLPVHGQPAPSGPKATSVLYARPSSSGRFHHARHQRDAVAAGGGGELPADGAVQRLGHRRERRVHLLLLVRGVLREGDQRGAVARPPRRRTGRSRRGSPDVGAGLQLPQGNPHASSFPSSPFSWPRRPKHPRP
jgi:regulator of protease activity HflC (stomatin/prohibitin superfamily)